MIGLSDDNGGLSAASPPRVGEDLVVLYSYVVALIHPDAAVQAVMDLVLVDPDIVTT